MIHATGVGVVLLLIAGEPEDRDPALSGATREAVLAVVTTDTTGGPASASPGSARAATCAVALKAVLPEVAAAFTPAELALLAEWLDRLA